MSALVLAAQRGDVQAFEALIGQWKGPVCAISLSMLRDVPASEEVAQEVFLAAWQNLSRLQRPASFGPWLRQLTRNKALEHLRARRRRLARVSPDSEVVAQASSGGDPLLDAEERAVLQEALDALPDDARDVMVLFYREGQSIKQVAALLELSESAVKKRLSRARAVVRADVLERLGHVVTRSAPGAAFTAGVLHSLAPAPALAATASVKLGAARGALAGAGMLGATLAAILLGYWAAERVTAPENLPILHRARNLSVLGLGIAAASTLLGPWAMVLGIVQLIAVLGWVQFRVLPRAWPVGEDAPLAARIGPVLGALGWAIGSVCGLGGAVLGAL